LSSYKYYKVIDVVFNCEGVYKLEDNHNHYKYVGGAHMGDEVEKYMMCHESGYELTEISKEEAFIETL